MNCIIKIRPFVFLIAAAAFGVFSCKKDNSVESTATDASTVTTSSTITVAASSGLRITDSLYIVQPCPRGAARDSITESALPASVTSYLSTNYSGFTFGKAYSIKNSNGDVIGYVAIIYYNNKPVAVAFGGTGTFVKVLEQREKGDLDGQGWHHGGRFEDRGGIIKDTIALVSLPGTITSYLTTNYPADTLLKAFINRDSSFIVITKDDGIYASLFKGDGSFVKRIELPSKPAIYQVKDQASLPVNIQSYLETSYPDYTLKKAFALSLNGNLKAYIVIIDANNTKYALEFDATGTFVRAKTLF